MAAQSVRFHGDMRHAKLDLHFDSETRWNGGAGLCRLPITSIGQEMVPAAGHLSGRLIDMAGASGSSISVEMPSPD